MTAVFALGCGKASDTDSKKVVLNEVAHSVFYAPMYVALENGYFTEEGLDVELVTGFGADKTMTALLSGEADIGFMGPESTIYTYQGGMEDYAVNFAQLTQRAGNFLVGRTPDEAFTFEKLKGAVVLGGRAGGMPQMVFEYILKKNGIDPTADLTIDQSIDFGATAAAFSGGQGEYTVEFEPHATALEEKGDGYVLTSLGEASGYVPYTAFSARKSYIAENPEVIAAFTRALQKGMEYVNSHTPAEVASVIKPQFEETADATLETIISRYAGQDTWKADLIFSEDAFALLQDILMDAGELDALLPYEELVNTEFASQAASGSGQK
ncbi:MAG: ABC transporter substrate-binding protein [Lachnospiraceae bacterium]|nr:ABC transporter substrate-binding protein [Lachnospiraceae bacterium]